MYTNTKVNDTTEPVYVGSKRAVEDEELSNKLKILLNIQGATNQSEPAFRKKIFGKKLDQVATPSGSPNNVVSPSGSVSSSNTPIDTTNYRNPPNSPVDGFIKWRFPCVTDDE